MKRSAYCVFCLKCNTQYGPGAVMFFKPYYLGCLSHASYLLGGSSGEAAVIDPQRDVDIYLADAEDAGLTIRHVIETHLHADFVSGHAELAERAGATIHIGAAAGARFRHHAARDGDEIALGDVTLRLVETPGHTPESMTVLAFVAGADTQPAMAFTGDTLFIGDVGRPDLAGGQGHTADQMARRLYRSLAEKLLPLSDETKVWPAHGAGSACGRALSDDHVSTMGRERATNPALGLVLRGDEAGFVRYATEGLAPAPLYFAHDAQANREGAASVQAVLAGARPLDRTAVERLAAEGVVVLDVRPAAAFGAAHVPGALNVPLEGRFASWAGSVVAPDSRVVVVAEPGRESEAILRLARVGIESVAGWLQGGMEAWTSAGGPAAALPQMSAAELRHALRAGRPLTLLDVRAHDEWEAGHVADAVHVPLAELEARMAEAPAGPLAVMCGSGYRSAIASSMLLRGGRRDVSNVVGGWEAWSAIAAQSARQSG